MTHAAADELIGNPFATRHVRPGRLPAFDAAGRPVDLSALLVRLAAIGGSAAIVGRHGSGKTTLLGHLADALEKEGRRVLRASPKHARDTVTILAAVARARGGGIVCVDSWERLGECSATIVRWCAAAGRAGLIVTAHREGQLPTLWECTTTPAVLRAIVGTLPRYEAAPPIVDRDLEEAFRTTLGDIREALFLLYDRFEDRCRSLRARRRTIG